MWFPFHSGASLGKMTYLMWSFSAFKFTFILLWFSRATPWSAQSFETMPACKGCFCHNASHWQETTLQKQTVITNELSSRQLLWVSLEWFWTLFVQAFIFSNNASNYLATLVRYKLASNIRLVFGSVVLILHTIVTASSLNGFSAQGIEVWHTSGSKSLVPCELLNPSP